MADQQGGSFSDLYEVMQQRKGTSTTPRPARRDSSPAPKPAPPVVSKSREVGKEGSRERGKETSQPGNREVGKPIADLNERPYRKDSFMFTDTEFHALEQLKLDLRSKHDLPATKNDLARSAIGYMLSDYRNRGEGSFIVELLKTKGTR